MKPRRTIRPYPNNHEQIGLIASLVVHAVLATIVFGSYTPTMQSIKVIEVSLEPPNRYQQQAHIVSPSDAASKTPNKEAARLSDSDSRADIETIRRGNEGGAPGQHGERGAAELQKKTQSTPSKRQPSSPQRTQPKEQDTSATKHHDSSSPHSKRDLNLKDLKLDDSTLALKFGNKPKNQATAQSPAAKSSLSMSLSDYQAFSRPPGSGAAFFGSAGISDHLPNLPDGDITLLNAKANIYASFVRRVAIQVFTQLRSQGWERLSAQQIRQLRGFATVVAILDTQGRLIRTQIIESSGSDAFDTVLLISATKGASDPNPPPGAQAKDGTIRFIFKARSWSQIGVSRRSGAPMEQRWLLLATGLE